MPKITDPTLLNELNGQQPAQAGFPGVVQGRPKPPEPVDPVEERRDQIGLSRDEIGLERDRLALEKMQAETAAAELSTKLGKEAGFYLRSRASGSAFDELDVGAETQLRAAGKGVLPDSWMNEWTPEKRQKAEAYMSDFIAASLRYESGAAIPPEEFNSQARIFFPQAGDSKATLEVKRQLRQNMIQSLAMGAGPEAVQEVDRYLQNLGGGEERTEEATYANGYFDEQGNPLPDDYEGGVYDENGEYIGLVGSVSIEGETYEQEQARKAAEAARQEQVQFGGEAGGTISDAATLGKQGISLGLSDEAAGIGGALSGLFNGQGIVGGYTSARDQERARIDIARENLGGVGTALEVAGGGAGILARPGQVMAAGRSVAATGQPITRPAVQNALARQAGRDGARIGAVGGFGYGEGLEGSAVNTAGGALLGGALGYGGQRLGNALANRATPRRDASDLARAGQAEGVTVNRAMADPNLENTFSGAEASTAGPRINKAMNEIEGQVSGRVEALGRGARAEQPDVRGGTVQDTVTDYLGTTKERAGRLFDQVSVPPETRVQLSITRQALAEITEGMKSNPELSQIWVSHPRLRRTLDALTPEDIATPASREVKRLSFDLESAEDALVRLNRSEEGGSPEADALRSTIAGIKQQLQRADRQSQRAPMGGEVSWKDMKRLRTIVGEITGQPGLSADGAQTKAMRKFYAAISSDMESTATAMGPVAQKQWQRASDAWAKRENFVDNIASKLVGNPNNPRSTRQAANTLDAWVKGDFSRFQKLWGSFSKNERDMIRASVADELGRNAKGEFTPAHFLNATSGKTRAASDRALRLMFGEDGVRSIQNLRTLSTELNRLNAKRNSSNTGRVNTYRDWLANALLGGGGVGAGVGLISGSGATGAAAAIGTAAAVGGANSVRNTLTANMLLNPKISKWLSQAPRTTNPKAIDAHFNRLGEIAKAEPALAGEIETLRRGILGAANDNATAGSSLAAENQNAEER